MMSVANWLRPLDEAVVPYRDGHLKGLPVSNWPAPEDIRAEKNFVPAAQGVRQAAEQVF
jgi:hypothetical protein